MLRGFRWQLVALLLAMALVFAAGLFNLSRQSNRLPTPEHSPTATIDPTEPRPPTAVVSQAIATPLDPGPVVYREGLVGSVQRLNPLFAHLNPPDQDIASLIFEGLFAFNDYGEAVPRLASELIISSDGLDYVVRLREDIQWQNGLPFGADDVVFTTSLLSDPLYSEFSSLGMFWQSVETQKLNQSLVRFRLAQPYSSFPNLLTIGILPEHALRDTTIDQLARHPFNLSPIGTGAYQLAGLDTADGQTITGLRLALSPIFRQRQEAKIGFLVSELDFRFYKDLDAATQAYHAREIDGLAGLDPQAVQDALPHSQYYRQVKSTLGILIFNWNNALFEERRVRQALSLGLDVHQLVQTHFGIAATHADSPFILGSSAYKPHRFWTTYELAEAQSLLNSSDDTASEIDDDDDESDAPVEPLQPYSLLVEDHTYLRSLAREIVAQWQLLGLEFIVESLDDTALKTRLESGDFTAAIIMQRIGADSDLLRFWHPAEALGGRNYGAASDNELAELLEEARGEIYDTRRALLYRQLQDVFAEQVIAVPLFYPVFTFAARDSFEGIQLGYLTNPADRFRGIKDWRPTTTAS